MNNVAELPLDNVALKSVAPRVPRSPTSIANAVIGDANVNVMVSGVEKCIPIEPSVGITVEVPKKPEHHSDPSQETSTVGNTSGDELSAGASSKLSRVVVAPPSAEVNDASSRYVVVAKALAVMQDKENAQA